MVQTAGWPRCRSTRTGAEVILVSPVPRAVWEDTQAHIATSLAAAILASDPTPERLIAMGARARDAMLALYGPEAASARLSEIYANAIAG